MLPVSVQHLSKKNVFQRTDVLGLEKPYIMILGTRTLQIK